MRCAYCLLRTPISPGAVSRHATTGGSGMPDAIHSTALVIQLGPRCPRLHVDGISGCPGDADSLAALSVSPAELPQQWRPAMQQASLGPRIPRDTWYASMLLRYKYLPTVE
jgi:hypothetical protein